MPLRRRVLVLPLAAVVLVGLVAWSQWRVVDDRRHVQTALPAAVMKPLPRGLLFERYDTGNRPVRLVTYLGRHRVLLVFLGDAVVDPGDLLLGRLARRHSRLDPVVIVIGGGLPQQHRRVMPDGWMFPVLSDAGSIRGGAPLAIHRLWGLWDSRTGTATSGVFLLDRAGRVAWDQGRPRPLSDPAAVLDAIGVDT